jgi:cyclic di-GMP phosphodiesterase
MTGHASIEQIVSSVKLHAADFLLKPFTLDALFRSVSGAYERLVCSRQQLSERYSLASGLRERTEQLEAARLSLRDSYRSALETLVATLEAREPQTYAHSFRVRSYALHLARLMNYPEAVLPRLASAAVLHDIGKIAVSDSVLLKPGPLTKAEFEVLKIHSEVGERIVRRMGFMNGAAKIIRHHHEHFDGRGYPDGLVGPQIPFGSRLFAVADTLDAMTSNRCYRNALSLDAARTEIIRCAGTQFDPAIAETFGSIAPSTWAELRAEADHDARAAIIDPGSRPAESSAFFQVLSEFSPIAAKL